MNSAIIALLVLALLFSGCNALERTCGNGACDGWENGQSCPKDCKPLPEKELVGSAEANANG